MMNTAELAERLVASGGKITKAEAKTLVDGVFATIREAAARGEEISIPGFGKFRVQDKPARPGRNPRTGEAVSIKASRKLAFQPSKTLKDALAR